MKTIHDTYFDLCQAHIKKKKSDLVLLQVGSFYEAYSRPNGDGCAELLSDALNIHLTKKNNKKPFSNENPKMAGLPLINLERHLNVLLDNNFTVYIYDQNPNNPKDRKFRGCFTKNIRMEFDTESSIDLKREKRIYSCILEKYSITRNKIKLNQYKLSFAYLELNTAKMYFSESIDDHYIRMIEQFLLQHHPNELLFYVNENLDEIEKHDIQNDILKDFEIHIYVPEKNYDKMEQVMQECFSKPPKDLHYYTESMNNMYRIIKHVQEYDPIQTKELLCDENPWLTNENDTILKVNRDLYKELFIFDLKDERSEDSKSQFRSIFNLFSHSMNCMGKRKLARILNCPVTCSKEIDTRYTAIENCALPKTVFQDLIDLETYYLKWTRSSLNTKLVAKLLLAYQSISSYYPSLSTCLDFIEQQWDLKNMVQGEDYFRNPSEEYKTWCSQYEKSMQKFFSFENQNIHFTFVDDPKNIQDSYFSIANTRWNKLSPEFKSQFRIISSKNSTTKYVMIESLESELHVLSSLLRKMEIYKKEYFLSQSKIIFENFGSMLLSINESIGNDSMYSVLKDFFQKNSYVRPVVQSTQSENAFFDIEGVRHPLIEKIVQDEVFVPFSSALNRDVNGHLVFGLNRSGKSTFMKSIATSIYLAQCGLFVPCVSLNFSPYFSIYSKLNHSDNLFRQQSLFYNEIVELQYILKRVHCDRSLLFLDELFQGTEIPSTIGLLLSLMEKLVQQKIQFVLSTHIHLISDIVDDTYKKRIRTSHFEMNDHLNLLEAKTLVTNSPNIFYNRNLLEGSGNSIYGIEIAEQLGLPVDMIQSAKEHRQHVHLEYDFKTNKKSKYNKKITMDQCSICHTRKNLEVHHIFQQKHFDKEKGNTINGFHKNMKQNLIVLCHDCHHSIENPSS